MTLSREALAANWRTLARWSGTAQTGAAVKADGYGLGAIAVVQTLSKAGCRDFFVAHWEEAQALMPYLQGANISVLHGVAPQEMALAKAVGAIPVLNSAAQIARWKAADGGKCHVMIDTGMNRLGLSREDVTAPLLDGLDIDICMSHLACADEDSDHNDQQRKAFDAARSGISARRYSLANSAGIMLGHGYHYDLTRPGLALYGGIARDEQRASIANVFSIQARILQIRVIQPGATIGYGATFTADKPMTIATLACGYADGFHRGFSNLGAFLHDGQRLPILGRVSMDLTCVDISAVPDLGEGDWLTCDYDLLRAEQVTGMSQYEHLTQLGSRFDRRWKD